MNSTLVSTSPNPNLGLLNHSTDLNKTLGILGKPHEESIAKFNPTKTRPKRRNRRNPAKSTSNPRTQKTPKSSPFTHGFGRGITTQRRTKGSHKFPPSNPQEKGPENNPKKSPREGSENHHQEQPGTTHPNLKESRRIIYTRNKGSYKVYLAARSSNPLTRSHHEALKLVLWKS
jgi:hypothetical protein